MTLGPESLFLSSCMGSCGGVSGSTYLGPGPHTAAFYPTVAVDDQPPFWKGGWVQSTFRAGRLPQDGVEEMVTSAENHLEGGMWRERVPGAWVHSTFAV